MYSKISSLGEILTNKFEKSVKETKEKSKRGCSYEWQDHAVRVAKKLNISKLSKQWFSFFKSAHKKNLQGMIDAVYTSISDLPSSNQELYFYKVFWNKVKEKQCQTKK